MKICQCTQYLKKQKNIKKYRFFDGIKLSIIFDFSKIIIDLIY